MIIGYAAGAYDLFHYGHLEILRKAKENCDYLIAGVVHDDVLEQTKGRRPVIPIDERAAIVSHIDYVDEVYIETTPDKIETWHQKPFNVFFKGDDWKGTPQGLALEKRFAEVGVSVHYFPYTEHTSSTKLRRGPRRSGRSRSILTPHWSLAFSTQQKKALYSNKAGFPPLHSHKEPF